MATSVRIFDLFLIVLSLLYDICMLIPDLEVHIVNIFEIRGLISSCSSYLRTPFFKLSIARFRTWNVLNIHMVLTMHKACSMSKSIWLRPRYVIRSQSTGRRRVGLLPISTIRSSVKRALLNSTIVPCTERLIVSSKLETVLTSVSTDFILWANVQGGIDLHGLLFHRRNLWLSSIF